MNHVDRAISGRAFGRFTHKQFQAVKKILAEKYKGKPVPKREIFKEIGLRWKRLKPNEVQHYKFIALNEIEMEKEGRRYAQKRPFAE